MSKKSHVAVILWKLLVFLKYPEKLTSDVEIWHIWKTLIGKWPFKNVFWQSYQQFSCVDQWKASFKTPLCQAKHHLYAMSLRYGSLISPNHSQILSHSFSGASQLWVHFFAQQPRTNKNTRLTKEYVHEGKWTWLKSLSKGVKVLQMSQNSCMSFAQRSACWCKVPSFSISLKFFCVVDI